MLFGDLSPLFKNKSWYNNVMETNVGSTDQMVRLALGVALVAVSAAGYTGYVLALGPVVAGALAVVALALLATGYTRKCPACSALGIDTLEGSSGADIETGSPEDTEPVEEPEPEDFEDDEEPQE